MPHHQQEKQVADQAKEVIVNNYRFHASRQCKISLISLVSYLTLPRGLFYTLILIINFKNNVHMKGLHKQNQTYFDLFVGLKIHVI